MNDQDVIAHIIQTREDIASIKTMLTPLIPRMDSHEARIGVTESDVKTIKRVWSSLFSLLLVSMGVATAWVKGLFNG